jgi:hypothetical protein
MEKTVVNVELRGPDIELLAKLKASLRAKAEPSTSAAALRHALRMTAKSTRAA